MVEFRARRVLHRGVSPIAIAAGLVLVLAGCTGSSSASHAGQRVASATGSGGIGGLKTTPAGPIIHVGHNPIAVAVDEATHTAYVGNGNDKTLSVINTLTCDAVATASCRTVSPTVAVGGDPVAAAVDQSTDTVYVTDLADNTVSMVDGRTCNSTVTTGCGQTTRTIAAGGGPDGIAIDQLTDTVYVADDGAGGDDSGDTVSVIDGATCNSVSTTGCGQKPATVRVGFAPAGLAVDEATHTLYVPNANPGGLGSISVVDAKTCNARTTSGCHGKLASISSGSSPFAVAVDQSTDTVYETATGPDLGWVYVIDGATCNASVTTGCRQKPRRVTVGSDPVGATVDPTTHDVLVLNQEDSTVSVIDGRTCNGRRSAGCATSSLQIATGFHPGRLALDAAHHTLFVTDQDENAVSVLDSATCTPSVRSGCRQSARTTTVGSAPSGVVVDSKTNTVYVANRDNNTLSVIDGAKCNAQDLSGCARRWTTMAAGAQVQEMALDPTTSTIYAADSDPANDNAGATLSVLDTVTCNARSRSGCARQPAEVAVGQGPTAVAVDVLEHTAYVANFLDATLSMVDTSLCNGARQAGCATSPATVRVGGSPKDVLVDPSTQTVYVANSADGTVSVLDAATCNATVSSGCGSAQTRIAVGKSPYGLALDASSKTLYVADEGSGTVSVIKAAECNALRRAACTEHPTTIDVEGAPYHVVVDQTTAQVFVASVDASDVDVIDGKACNAEITSGCEALSATVLTGGWPAHLNVNPATGTVYVADNVDAEVSLFSIHASPRATP